MDLCLSVADLSVSTADLFPSAADLSVSAMDLCLSAADLSVSAMDLFLSAADPWVSTTDLFLSAADLWVSTTDLFLSAADPSASTTDLFLSAPDLSVSTTHLLPSAADLSVSAIDLLLSSADLWVSATDLPLSSADLWVSATDPCLSAGVLRGFTEVGFVSAKVGFEFAACLSRLAASECPESLAICPGLDAGELVKVAGALPESVARFIRPHRSIARAANLRQTIFGSTNDHGVDLHAAAGRRAITPGFETTRRSAVRSASRPRFDVSRGWVALIRQCPASARSSEISGGNALAARQYLHAEPSRVVEVCRAQGVPVQAYLSWAFDRLGTHREVFALPLEEITPAAFMKTLG